MALEYSFSTYGMRFICKYSFHKRLTVLFLVHETFNNYFESMSSLSTASYGEKCNSSNFDLEMGLL